MNSDNGSASGITAPDIDYQEIIDFVKQAGHDVLMTMAKEIVHTKNVEQKLDGSIVTEADNRMQKVIRDQLEKLYPEFSFLGEEMTAEEQKQEQQDILSDPDQYLWCLDPLDGTTNYSIGLPFWAVSLALMNVNGVVFGVVYDPERQECFSAIKGRGALFNGEALVCASAPHDLEKAVADIDLKRLDAPLRRKLVDEPEYRSQRNMGACALEWCWLAIDRFQIYLHGGMKHWDYAAGCLILAEAGGVASTLEGKNVFDLRHNNQSVVAATNQILFDRWFKYLST